MIRINLLGTPKAKNRRGGAAAAPAIEIGDVGSPMVKVLVAVAPGGHIVVTTVSAILQRVPPRPAFPGTTLQFRCGGKLVKAERKARLGRNPQTGETIKIKAKTVVKFRVAKVAKDTIAPPKK